jgi:hypothetical protein
VGAVWCSSPVSRIGARDRAAPWIVRVLRPRAGRRAASPDSDFANFGYTRSSKGDRQGTQKPCTRRRCWNRSGRLAWTRRSWPGTTRAVEPGDVGYLLYLLAWRVAGGTRGKILGDGRSWQKGASRWLAGPEGDAAAGHRCSGTRAVPRGEADGPEVFAGAGRPRYPLSPPSEIPELPNLASDRARLCLRSSPV